jgi:hypothetical protein
MISLLTNLNFLSTGKPWPVDDLDTKLRLESYEKNKLLFEGHHSSVFRDLNRLLREDESSVLAFSLNWHKRLTTTFANMLWGETPNISTSTSDQYLKSLIEYNDFYNVGYEVTLDALRYSPGIIKIGFDGERATIESQNPAFWYPVVNPDNIKKIQYHVLAWTFEEVDWEGKKTTFLRAEIHSKGKIENKLFQLENGKIGKQIKPISSHTRYKTLKDEQNTGVNDFLIIPIFNLQTSDNPFGQSDYEDINSLIEQLELRICQITRILNRHSLPNMAGPESCLSTDPDTGEMIFISGNKYWPLESGEAPPVYITWDGKLDSAFRQMEFLLDQLYALSETSSILYGDSGKLQRADSSAALKRLLISTLSKINRLKLSIDPKMKKALKIASQIEVLKKVPDAVELTDIKIGWRDGLPEDPKEIAEIVNLKGPEAEELKNEIAVE